MNLTLRIGKKWANTIVSRSKSVSRLSAVCTKEKQRIYNETLDIFSSVCYYIGNNIRAYCGFSPFLRCMRRQPVVSLHGRDGLIHAFAFEADAVTVLVFIPFLRGEFHLANSAKTDIGMALTTGAVAIANAFGCVPPGPLRERKTYAGGHRTQCRVAFASYFL